MARLVVSDFSCIEEADLELSKLTIIIGPQASGKSVLSKLIYFFYDILSRQFRALEDEHSLDQFRESIEDDFKKWFPPSAWGASLFSISFSAGEFFVKIARPNSKKKKPDPEAIRVNLSPWFESEYTKLLQTVKTKLRGRASREDIESPSFDFETFYRLQSAATRNLEATLGPNYVGWQLFVPAGRSFFTSLGKAIAAFEYSGMLDPATLQFGRFFASIRDRRRARHTIRRIDKAEQQSRNEMMRKLFGGQIKFDRDLEYVESEDGRKIPFPVLSSGQQELLPL